MDQTYCVPDHSIHDNVSVIRDLIDVCDISLESVGLVFQHQEKAFDYVSHEYLSEILKRFGFRSFILSCIHLGFSDIFGLLNITMNLCPIFALKEELGRAVHFQVPYIPHPLNPS